MSTLPLEGIRVADFTQVAQGPFATLLLAQMGAEVIKIETAGRVEGPRDPLAGAGRNFSKKSLTLNLKVPQGLEALKELVKVSDIVMENYATGVMERLGVGYEDLRKVKPDIVMLSSQGLGRTGDLRDAVSYYAEVQNFAGLSHLAGYKDGKMGTVQSIWGDHLTAMLLIFAVLADLLLPGAWTRRPTVALSAHSVLRAVNDWIRTRTSFDGVFDFDRVVRDPDSPNLIYPPYDCDGIHPTARGYYEMGKAINLGLFAR